MDKRIFGIEKERVVLIACLGLAAIMLLCFSFAKETQYIQAFAEVNGIEIKYAQSEFYAYKRGERIGKYIRP